jgi:hypothetical protein
VYKGTGRTADGEYVIALSVATIVRECHGKRVTLRRVAVSASKVASQLILVAEAPLILHIEITRFRTWYSMANRHLGDEK